MKRNPTLTSKLLVALLVATVLLCASARPAFSLVDLAGNPVPNTATSSTSAQLVGSPTLLTKLAEPNTPADDDPLVLAQLGSPNSPEDDLLNALDSLAAAATAGDPAAAAAARQLALDILEGKPLAGKAYSGIPLLNWNSPAKVQTVPAGGNVVVKVVRFGQHIVSDTWLLSFADPSQPFTITYRVAVLSAAFGGQLTPTPLLADGSVPIGGLHSVLQPLALPGALLTGTQTSSRFHPAGVNEGFRLGVQDITVRMPPARMVTAILDPSLKRGRESLATLEPATPARLAAAQAAFGFSGSVPTEAEKIAAIGVLGNAAPEKQLWTDLRALNPADPGFLPAAQGVAAGDRQLVAAMRTRTQVPNGIAPDPTADVSVVLLNNEAYVSTPGFALAAGGSLRVSVTNADGFARSFQATDLKNRRPVQGPLDWGEFDWAPLPLGASPDLAAGASRTFTLTPAASSFALWLGDSEHGDQAGVSLALDRSARKQSLRFSPDFSMPLHETQDNSGNIWMTLPGVDKIGKLTPAADLHASTYEEYLLPGGAHDPNATVPPLGPHDVVVDSHGIVWVTLTLGNAIARIDPAQTVPDTTRGIRIYPLGPCNDGFTFCRVVFPPNPLAPPTRQPLQMADLEDGRGNTVLWFTEAGANLIGVLRAAPDGTLLEQSDFPCGCTGPLGIALDADGSVWFTEDFSNRIARLKPSQAQPFTAAPTLDHFNIPSSVAVFDPEHPGGAVTAVPHSLVLDRQGRVWFTEAATGKIGFLDPALAVPGTTNGFTEFALPPNEFKGVAVPADLTIDRAGTVYWSDEYGDIIGTLTAAAGPGPPFRPQERRSLTDAPMVDAAGNLWFMEAGSNIITRISGVTAGLPAPAPSPVIEANTGADTVTGTGLQEMTSVDVAVLRGGAVVAHRNGVVLAAGGFAVGNAANPWTIAPVNALRRGDVVRLTPNGPFAAAPFSFKVPGLTAAVRTDGSLGGAALSGSAAVFGKVDLQFAGGPATAAISPADGSFSFTPPSPLAPTTTGSVSWSTATVAAIFRTVTSFAPQPPPATDLAAASDSGVSPTDNVTKVTTPTFDGTAPASAPVNLYVDSVLKGSGTATAAGTYSLTASVLTEGVHAVTVTTTDGDGSESALSSALSVTIDTTAPAAPAAAPDLVAASDTGASPTDNVTKDTTPTFSGTALAAATMILHADGLATGSAAVGAGDSYSVSSSALADGIHAISASALDAAGNESVASSALSITIDTLAASVSAPQLDPLSDTGSFSNDNITKDTTPTFTGSAEAGATVTIAADGSARGSGSASGGAYAVTSSALADGAHAISTSATDLAGNASPASSTLTITIDTIAPGVPAAPDLTAASDTGESASDNITSDSTPSFSGSAAGAARIALYDGTSARGSAGLSGGNYLVTSASLTDGVHAISVGALDLAGNESAPSAALSITIDTLAPGAPPVPDLTAASDSGESASDNLTNIATPTFSGAAAPNSRVTILAGGIAKGSALTAADGSYAVTSGVLAEGVHSISARASDVAGNASPASGALALTIDLTAPGAPSAPDLTAASDSGSSATDNLTNVASPSFSGTGVAGSRVRIYSDGLERTSALADAAGAYLLGSGGALADGAHTIAASAADAAGNESIRSTGLSITIDTAAPLAPSVPDLLAASDSGSSASDNITNDATPTFGGSAEGNSSVAILADGVAKGSANAAPAGAYSVATSTLADGAHVISARATDGAGNESAASGSLSVTIDTAAPAVPSVPDLAASSDSGASSSDDITNDSTPTLLGSAEAGATLRLLADGAEKGSASATAGGAYSVTSSALADGPHAFGASATDAAGNESAFSTTLLVTIDTVIGPPSAPDLDPASDTGSSSTDNITGDATPTFDGNAEAGSTVTILVDGTAKGSSVAGAAGAYSVTTSVLTVATHSVAARALDLAGNLSTISAALSVTILQAPAPPAVPDLDAASDSGASSSDNLTNITTPTFSGTAEANATVKLFVDDVLNTTASASSAGGYSVMASALADGPHNISVSATNVAGTESAHSSALSITIDTIAPGAPATPDLTAASDSGESASDNLTNIAAPTFAGSAAAGSRVTIFAGATAKGSVLAGADGSYAVTSSVLAEGSHSISVTATDAAGNASLASGALALTIDLTAPGAPSSPGLTAASDSGVSASDNLTNVAAPSFAGSALARSRVRLYADGLERASALADAAGAYLLGSGGALSDGAHTMAASAADAAGNESIRSAGLSITIDTTAPLAPSVPDLLAASDSGSSASDNITNDATPSFSGSAENNASVAILADGVAKGSGGAPAGSYSVVTSTIVDGVHAITARATDAAGNQSAGSGSLSVTIDTAAPLAPSVPDLAASSDSGASSSDNITNDSTPTLLGSAEAGASLRLFADGSEKGSGSATGGAYSITSTALADGPHAFGASATDAAGNESAVSSTLLVTIDTVIGPPSAPDLDPASDTGSSSTDNVTGDTTPTFNGNAEAGSTVTVLVDGTAKGSAVAGAGGAYAVTTSVLTVATHSVASSAVDLAGNLSTLSGALSVTILQAPAQPAVPDLQAASDSGTSNEDNLTSNKTPTFAGSAEANATVKLYVDDVLKGTSSASSVGSYSVTSSALADGVHSVAVSATNLAGNESGHSGSLAIRIDTQAPVQPAAPDLDAASDSGVSRSDNVTNDTTPLFNGIAEAGSTVSLQVDGLARGSSTAAGDGSYSVSSGALGAGGHAVSAVATDPAGNASLVSAALALTIDVSAPAAPTVPDLAAASDSGVSTGDNLTNDATPSFAGSAEAGASISLFADGAKVAGGQVGADGSYALTSDPLSDGLHGLSAGASDVAGNVSPASGSLSVRIDTQAPAVPAAPDLADSSDSGSSASDNVTNDATPSLNGSAESAAAVSLFVDGARLAGGQAGADGSWSLTASSLTDGAHALSAAAADAAGNESGHSPSLSVRIDTQAPAAPSTPDLTPASDTGASNSDNITSDISPSFRGNAEAAASIALLVDGTSKGSALADASGVYLVTSDLLTSGAHAVRGRVSDTAGNASMTSSALQVTIVVPLRSGPTLVRGSGALSVRIVRGSAGGSGSALAVGSKFGVGTAAKLRLRVLSPSGRALPLLKGSRLGSTRVAPAQLKALGYVVERPGQVAFSLRLPLARVRPGVRYQIEIRATEPDGTASILRLVLRRK